MWFGDDSSKAAVSTVSCGGDAVCYGRAGERLYVDARGMDETQDARNVDYSPGERCVEEPGYIMPVLVAGPPVYAWVVTGSLLFRSPPDVYGAAYNRLCCASCGSKCRQYSGVLVS